MEIKEEEKQKKKKKENSRNPNSRDRERYPAASGLHSISPDRNTVEYFTAD